MAPSTLLLNHLIPRDSIELGRLIVDPQYPAQDYFQPSPTVGFETSSNATVQQIEDFEAVLSRTNNARIQAKILSLVTLGPISHSRTSSTTVKARTCVTRLLENPRDFLRDLCRDEVARTWLESEFQRQPRTLMSGGWRGRSVYLVCGFKSLTDARVSQTRGVENGTDIAAAAPLPISPVPGVGLDIEAGVGFTKASSASSEFTTSGEHVYAVQYRKLRFSAFSSRNVDNTFLESKNRWKVLIDVRGGGNETAVEDGLEVDVDEPLGERDMRGPYVRLDADQDEVFYWEDDEAEDDIETY
ncbi:hypothetical protein CkaCkLH20_09785 [Colletotrichum karsti]|uniref:Uncharacterized protein n=1 Tax=Colletotrichum karsti TaxID=1095194 RepID=A0A9P6I0G3_9PEZI|nr:uncharacterized protein CkaCkLH20_09785 [Colletotrichum karsti]KAF9872606.1 hypothetical protein CkaCkLH20_09785 [Colletotrichum karsti]